MKGDQQLYKMKGICKVTKYSAKLRGHDDPTLWYLESTCMDHFSANVEGIYEDNVIVLIL